MFESMFAFNRTTSDYQILIRLLLCVKFEYKTIILRALLLLRSITFFKIDGKFNASI
jgi:hypothetical protein